MNFGFSTRVAATARDVLRGGCAMDGIATDVYWHFRERTRVTKKQLKRGRLQYDFANTLALAVFNIG